MEKSNQPVIVGLAAALGVALLAIAYLLGRASAPPPVVTVAAPAPAAAAQTIEDVPTAPPATLDQEPGAALVPVTEAPAFALPRDTSSPLSSAPPPMPVSPAGNPLSPGAAEKQQVASYFEKIEQAADMGAGDPQAFANSLMQSVSSGDFSEFDALLVKARNQRQRVQAMAPPRSCSEHHKLALTLAGDSVAMLEKLKAALMKGDSTALLSIASEGKALESKTNELKAMGDAIKRQAGL